MKNTGVIMGFILAQFAVGSSASIKPVPFTNVKVEDAFWSPRMETNRKVTVPYCFKKCEETGRISNFAKAGKLMEGDFEGRYYNDSDLYKVIEGAAYSLQIHPDAELQAYVDKVIDQIAAAQWEDGYLYTFYSLPQRQSDKRWTDIRHKHELYCAGHFFEAACAYYQATGKRKILDTALKLADHIDSVFGPGRRSDPPGHEEIEIGLVKLYRLTGNEKYLKLAQFFVDQRGNAEGHTLYGPYAQDHKPVLEQTQAEGHAVRACYLYTGMADIAALNGNEGYVHTLDRIWENTVYRKLYITGGIGSRRSGEAFGDEYELPNKTAYNETCAAIGNAMWNHRMFLLNGDAKYIDVLERIIYNGFLSGVSLSGDRFFYPNPLASDGKYQRKEWFDCSCCPVNVVRFVPSIPGYMYAVGKDQVYVNLFIGGRGSIELDENQIDIVQWTNYPWEGDVQITVEPQKKAKFTLSLRIPGWSQNQPLPGDLYRFLDKSQAAPALTVNGKAVPLKLDKGFVHINRKWKKGDSVQLKLPMPIRRVLADEKVKDDAGRAALQRGPMIFCLEGIDNGGQVSNLVLSDSAELKTEFRKDLLGGVQVITADAAAVSADSQTQPHALTAIPYYAWANRDAGPMQVWIARDSKAIELVKSPERK